MPPTAQFDFPGVQRVLDFTYTCSVGVTPGVISVRALPALTPFGSESIGPGYGTFRFSDGVQGLTVRDCRLAPNGFRQTQDASGRVWEFTLHDRRWRWDEGYAIDGDYNQLDDHKKLIPKTVRSPYQLACLCLDAMGEIGYSVDMPAGLCCQVVPGVVGLGGPGDVLVDPRAEYLRLGQNFPATNTNPRVTWDWQPAARVLANLCSQYGRVVVYNPAGDQVSVQVLGTGALPPSGAVLNLSPGFDPPRVPLAIIARGAETRFQMRLAFRPVARDWDDSWQPLDSVSYAPAQAAQQMDVLVYGNTGSINGVPFFGSYQQIADQITNSTDPRVRGKLIAAVVTTGGGTGGGPLVAECLRVTGLDAGYEFDPSFTGEMVCLAGPCVAGTGFTFCNPNDFSEVVATANLTYQQARERALSSVWRDYQMVAVDPADPTKRGTPIPGGGRLFERFLAVLQDTRPEQVAPRPGDVNRVDPATGQPYFEDTYNGYSKDRAPATFGRLHFNIAAGGNWADGSRLTFSNTPRRSRFYVPFTIVDPLRGVVQFSQAIYGLLGGATARETNAKLPAGVLPGQACFLPTDLVVETGVTLLDPITRSPLRYTYALALAGATAPARTIRVQEAQADSIGLYDSRHNLTGVTTSDLYAQNCAAQQCLATALTYQTGKSLTAPLVGIVPVALSGATRQVTWAMSRAGFTTTASVNSEHSTVTLPFPARRLRENLTQDAARAAQNLASRPDPANAVRRLRDAL